MKTTILALLVFALYGCSTSHQLADQKIESCPLAPKNEVPVKLWETKGFDMPESVVYDQKSKSYFVSNIVGSPTAKDGKGWISKLDKNGRIQNLKWATGRHRINKKSTALISAPKGMRIKDNQLWVTDIDQVLSISIPTGKVKRKIEIPGAKFLNDIAFSPKNKLMYVSDMFNDRVHIVKRNKHQQIFLDNKELEGPNGLLFQNDQLIVASWGPNIKSDFSTTGLGKILIVDQKTKRIKNWNNLRVGHLDGIEFIDSDTVIVSDWKAGKIFKVKKNGDCSTLIAGFKGSADIAYLKETKTLVVPVMMENTVVAYKLE